MKIRPPAVAGSFYDLDKERLKKQIKACFNHPLGPKKIKEEKVIATVVPHAGFIYSGPVAAWSYSRTPKANYIILGPNHRLFGSRFAIMKEGVWKTPLGGVEINEKVATELMKCPLIKYDPIAHQYEHSIEVQLPFLQYRFGDDFEFVPICVCNDFPTPDFLEQCRIVGKAIADVIKKQKKKWIVIASSDFSHYVPHDYAFSVDNYAIESILKLDEKSFFARVEEKNASICGFGPIAIAIVASRKLGAKKGKLLKYSTSGNITSEYSSVVGYASIIMK